MQRPIRSVQRKSTNLSLDARLIAEAKNLDINISRVAEQGIAQAVAEEKARLWKIENREAIENPGTTTSRSTACPWQDTGSSDGALRPSIDVSAEQAGYLLDVQTDLLDELTDPRRRAALPGRIDANARSKAESGLYDWRKALRHGRRSCSPLCRSAELEQRQANLSRHHDQIVAALDMLFQGF